MEILDLYTSSNRGGTHYRWNIGSVVHPSTGSNTDLPNNQYYYGNENPATSMGTNIFDFMYNLYGNTDYTLTLYTKSNDTIVIEYYGSWGNKYISLTFNRASSSGGYYNEENFGLYVSVVKNSPVLEAFRCVVLCKQFRVGQSAAYQFSNGGKELIAVADVGEFNPYIDGGTSGPGGGDPQKQNWSDASDIVLPSPLPDETHFGAQACGLITIFTPSDVQLQYLSDIIWGNGFLQFMQNLVENIADLFISLGMVPFTVDKGATVEVTWFDFAITGQQVGTGIMLTKAAKQLVEIDMGNIYLDGGDSRPFASDSVLDYSPYSRLGIYLPFIGYQELDIDECRNTKINLKYRIDILSGTCVAQITLFNESYSDGKTIYQFTGNCLTQLPLTAMDAQGLISNAVNIGIAAASAGATSSVASAGDALAQSQFESGGGNLGVEYDRMQHAFAANAAKVSNAQGSLAGATANGMMGMKPNFKKTGAISASASLMSVMQPYLFLETPRQSFPAGYNKMCGFPCNMGGTLGSFDGFTVVEDIRLNGLVATSPEVEEIYQLLKTGVII